MTTTRNAPSAIGSGALIGVLGGLIGLGGAEFRLPLLIGYFRFAALEAVIVNKATSLIVVLTALPFRAETIPFSAIAERWDAILALLLGSLPGAWLGAGWATRLRSAALHKVIAIMLIAIAAILLFGHEATAFGQMPLPDGYRMSIGVAAGFGIGVVAALLGVAGGELLIPTLILLFGADVKLAGSLSLVVSLPTMLVGFARYSRDQTFSVLGRNRGFVFYMMGGSILGTFIGGYMLGSVPGNVLLPFLAVLLILSAAKMWRH
ncbi:MAG: sulfite exporter TauE/SafE family protein [Alphaproteobacteria bacterium]|nr:sulfite exporter TauE/SafE family protein [Alphaproteobacteria bacterium]